MKSKNTKPVNEAEIENVNGGMIPSPIIIINPIKDDEENGKKSQRITPIGLIGLGGLKSND